MDSEVALAKNGVPLAVHPGGLAPLHIPQGQSLALVLNTLGDEGHIRLCDLCRLPVTRTLQKGLHAVGIHLVFGAPQGDVKHSRGVGIESFCNCVLLLACHRKIFE